MLQKHEQGRRRNIEVAFFISATTDFFLQLQTQQHNHILLLLRKLYVIL